MYYKKLFCCIFFIISNYAYAQVEYPSKCPSIEFLKTGGLDKISKENNLSYTASNKNNYGSNHDWIFKIKLIPKIFGICT